MVRGRYIKNIMETDRYIYESPDGGKTIYRRLPSTHLRQLIKQAPRTAHINRLRLWEKILSDAEADEQLNSMVEKIELLYKLRHS